MAMLVPVILFLMTVKPGLIVSLLTFVIAAIAGFILAALLLLDAGIQRFGKSSSGK